MNDRIANIKRPLFLSVFLFFGLCVMNSVQAITMHVEMTPEIAGENAVLMKPIGKNRTRFTVAVNAREDDKKSESKFPFVRTARLTVYGDKGLIVDCVVQPKKRDEWSYVFELENELAKRSTLVVSEHLDDGMVGGGSIYSYQLNDFIDPDARLRELIVLPVEFDPAKILLRP